MMIIDSQVHAYEADTPERPWLSKRNWPSHVTGDEMCAAMDEVGVDGAILVAAFSLYGYDASYAVSVRNAHPDRFALVKPVDAKDPGVADVIADWKATAGAVGIRLMLPHGQADGPTAAQYDRALREAARHDFPVNVLCWGNLDAGMAMIDRHPQTRFVIDHLGVVQPVEPPAPENPWTDLPKVVELARRPNAVIKISGACTLSRAGYPYADIWDPLGRIFDAWGVERCLWGTDWTRAAALLTYREGVEPFRLSDRLTEAERATLMGGACARTYGWTPRQPATGVAG